MKTLQYRRHGDKGNTSETKDLIMEEGLARAAKVAPQKDFTDYFHGLLVRTSQTLMASLSGRVMTGKLHPAIKEFGDGELFTSWVKDKGVPFGKDGLTNLQAVKHGLDEEYKQAQAVAALGVEKMFNLMADGGSGLAYGHSPIIEMAMEFFTPVSTQGNLSLNSYEGALFVQDDDGNIVVKKILRV